MHRAFYPLAATGAIALLLFLAVVAVAEPLPANTVTVFDTSGTTQADRLVSMGRPFREGEIQNFAQALVDGAPVPTQCDVKNRWPDGSVRFAIVTFVIPQLLPSGSVLVAFVNRPGVHAGGALTQQEMVAPEFDFDGTIEMIGPTTETVSARAMLATGRWRYWLKGPLVTAVIVEDRSPARSFDKDFGDASKALHPIFEAWFYPRNHAVELGYTVENTWASSTASKGMRDLSYGLVLRSGHSSPRVEFLQRPFKHIAKSRWHKRYWVGREPGGIRIDHNTAYLVTTRAIPNYDAGLKIAETLVAAKYEAWLKAPKTLDGDGWGIGGYAKNLTAGGAADWIGLLTTWDALYLLTMDERMREMAIGNADLSGRTPWHYREADTRAGTGHYFEAPLSGSVDTHGRVVSVNARRTVSLSDLGTDTDCGEAYRPDRIHTGIATSDGWETTRDHMPDTAYLAYLLTGRFYYLEELQYQAAFIIAHKIGCYTSGAQLAYNRQGHRGYLHDTQLRGDAWGFRTLAYAAALSPDETPEKAYFEDKLRNNIAAWEGEHDLPLSDPSRLADWTWARTYRLDPRGASPLGIWQDGPAFVQPPLYTDGRLKTAASPWEENFLLAALGMARNLGYSTDGLLRFMARPRLNLLLNPAANPYLIAEYRWPGKLSTTGSWIQTYPSFAAQFVSPPTTWLRDGTADHGYGFIALAALSYLTPYVLDGYSGRDAWALFKAHLPGQDRFAIESPKWAILPLLDPLPRRNGGPLRGRGSPGWRTKVVSLRQGQRPLGVDFPEPSPRAHRIERPRPKGPPCRAVSDHAG